MRMLLVAIPLLTMLCVRLDLSFAGENHLSVSDFRRLNPKSGLHELSGYITKHYQCPPCPKGAMCKPCMENNVLVSDQPEVQEIYPVDGDYVVIFTDEPNRLTLGVKYLITVEVLESKTNTYDVNDLKLRDAVEQSG